MLTRGVFRWVCAVFNNLVLSLHIQYCLHYFFLFKIIIPADGKG